MHVSADVGLLGEELGLGKEVPSKEAPHLLQVGSVSTFEQEEHRIGQYHIFLVSDLLNLQSLAGTQGVFLSWLGRDGTVHPSIEIEILLNHVISETNVIGAQAIGRGVYLGFNVWNLNSDISLRDQVCIEVYSFILTIQVLIVVPPILTSTRISHRVQNHILFLHLIRVGEVDTEEGFLFWGNSWSTIKFEAHLTRDWKRHHSDPNASNIFAPISFCHLQIICAGKVGVKLDHIRPCSATVFYIIAPLQARVIEGSTLYYDPTQAVIRVSFIPKPTNPIICGAGLNRFVIPVRSFLHLYSFPVPFLIVACLKNNTIASIPLEPSSSTFHFEGFTSFSFSD